MSRLSLLWVALLLPACVQVNSNEDVSLDANGVRNLSARVDRGDVRVFGRRDASTFDITATSWGRGSRRARAEDRQNTVGWAATVDAFTLVLDGDSIERRSGVDLQVQGPDLLDLDIIADQGTVEIGDIEGVHVITATSVTGTAIGDLDISTTSVVDLDFIPFVETDTFIDSGGSVTLAIPFGLPYDLTIRADGDDPIEVADLGWDDLVLGEGFVNGIRGRGEIEIDIRTNGSVRIVELR